MTKMIRIELSNLDLGQTIDALDTRAETYEKTAAYLDAALCRNPLH